MESIFFDNTIILSERQKKLYDFLCSGFRTIKQISEYMECFKNTSYSLIKRVEKYFPVEICKKNEQEDNQTIFWIDPLSFKGKYYKRVTNGDHIWLDKCEICKKDEYPNAGGGICLNCRKSHKHYKKNPTTINKSVFRSPKVTIPTEENLNGETWAKNFNKQITKALNKRESEDLVLKKMALDGNVEAMIRFRLKRTNGHSIK